MPTKKWETPCKICGEPFIHEQETEGFDGPKGEAVLKIISDWVHRYGTHEKCLKTRVESAQLEREDRESELRQTNWKAICPPLYQDTDDLRLPLQYPHSEVMAWKYGQRGIIAHGPTGTGKTRSLFRCLEELFLTGKSVYAITHLEFERKSTQGVGQLWRPRWVNEMMRADVFFLDDLGKVKFTTLSGEGKQSEALLFDIFENRITNQKPTFFSSENVGKDLIAAMSEERGRAFVRRIREFCLDIPFEDEENP